MTIWGACPHKVEAKAKQNFKDCFGFQIYEKNNKFFARPIITEPLAQVKGVSCFYYNKSTKRWVG